jgi:hypothetical protein
MTDHQDHPAPQARSEGVFVLDVRRIPATAAPRDDWARWIDNVFHEGYYQTLSDAANARQTEPNIVFWTKTHTELKAHWAEIEKHQC